MIKVNVIGGTISNEEKEAYVQRAKKLYPEKKIESMDITIVDGNYVDIEYHYDSVPFQRIRRVTGYLAGTLDRFNNAKRAEERDRVKHTISQYTISSIGICFSIIFKSIAVLSLPPL